MLQNIQQILHLGRLQGFFDLIQLQNGLISAQFIFEIKHKEYLRFRT